MHRVTFVPSCCCRFGHRVRRGLTQVLGWGKSRFRSWGDLSRLWKQFFAVFILASDAIASAGFYSPPVLVLPLRNAPNYSCSLIFKWCAWGFRCAAFSLAALAASAARASAPHWIGSPQRFFHNYHCRGLRRNAFRRTLKPNHSFKPTPLHGRNFFRYVRSHLRPCSGAA